MKTLKYIAEEYGNKIATESKSAKEAAVLGFHAGFEHGFALAEPLFFDPDEAPEEGSRVLAKPHKSPAGLFTYKTLNKGAGEKSYFVPCDLYLSGSEDAYCFQPEEIAWWTAIPNK